MKVPIYRGLIERNMIAGVPRTVAILGGTLGGALVLGMQNAWMILVLIPIYVILVVLYRSDPYLLEVLVSHVNEDDYLEP
jgi:type IV secretory pathway TrbD component